VNPQTQNTANFQKYRDPVTKHDPKALPPHHPFYNLSFIPPNNMYFQSDTSKNRKSARPKYPTFL
jgi:hypothetical protein